VKYAVGMYACVCGFCCTLANGVHKKIAINRVSDRLSHPYIT